MSGDAACSPPMVAVVGGGPAGLMAAEMLSRTGLRVVVYDAMPSVGRKFLLAGKGGLNLTHAEPFEAFAARYGAHADRLRPLLESFGPDDIRQWAQDLGVPTFVGTSGRVFPLDRKAAPLLRAWLKRLRSADVRFCPRHRWHGWRRDEGQGITLCFATPDGEEQCTAQAVILALGGGSWARLGSNGRWFAVLEQAGIALAPLRPANCGFDVAWSRHLRERFAGQPIKTVDAIFVDSKGVEYRRRGEAVLTENGMEGGLLYALSAPLRDEIEAHGTATLRLDLLPGRSVREILGELVRPRGKRSLASHLQSRLQLKGVKVALLHEILAEQEIADPERLAAAIKSLPVRLLATRPLDEAISTAGGVCFEGLDDYLMLRDLPGVFCAGEMLDWEAPTGGYLLSACLASGRAAGLGALTWLSDRHSCAVLS